MLWRSWAHKSHLVSPALTVLAEHQNILQHQIDLLEVVVDDVLPADITKPTGMAQWWCGGCLASWSSSRALYFIGLDQYIPLMILGAQDSKPWMQQARVLLRGHISVPYSSTERAAVLKTHSLVHQEMSWSSHNGLQKSLMKSADNPHLWLISVGRLQVLETW